MKKRLLVSLIAGTAVFGSVFAFAASLNGVDSDNLGADDDVVASCDTDGITTSYTVAYAAANDRWEVTHVVVGGLAALCEGETLSLTLTDSTDAVIGTASALVGPTTTSQSFDVTEDPSAEAVEDIHVVVTGDNVPPPSA
jgi:hypothetical protein